MTKAQLVEAINMYHGPEVTTRARKATLIEILCEREEMYDGINDMVERRMFNTGESESEAATHVSNYISQDMIKDDTSIDMDKMSKPMMMKKEVMDDMPKTRWDIIITVAVVAFVALSVYGIVFIE